MESPEAPKVALQVEQASRLNRFIVVSEVEFGGFFKEIEGVGGHEKKTNSTDDAECSRRSRWLRSQQERPED